MLCISGSDGSMTLRVALTDSLTSQLKPSLDMEGLTDPDPAGDSRLTATHVGTNSLSGTKRQNKKTNPRLYSLSKSYVKGFSATVVRESSLDVATLCVPGQQVKVD